MSTQCASLQPTCCSPHPPTARSTLWRYLFGRQARDLEQSNTAEDEYMISDTGAWAHVPLGSASCSLELQQAGSFFFLVSSRQPLQQGKGQLVRVRPPLSPPLPHQTSL